MTKSILISIRPEHVLNILNGHKTLELRKSVPKGFKGWVYVYVTKAKPFLYADIDEYRTSLSYAVDRYYENEGWGYYSLEENDIFNGKVVARFWFDEYDKTPFDLKYQPFEGRKHNGYCYYDRELNELCLTPKQILDYGKGKDLYTWHIKKLEVFDKVMELQELNILGKGRLKGEYIPLHHAPQPYQYVWLKE